jgi:hypothetical protein
VVGVKRRSQSEDGPPDRLRRLSMDDWCPGDPTAAIAAWREARRQRAAIHGRPGGVLVTDQEEVTAAVTLPDEAWRW